MAQYSLFVLKVPLNPKQTNWHCWLGDRNDIQPVSNLGLALPKSSAFGSPVRDWA